MPRFEAERTQDLGEVLRWYELQLLLLKEEDRRLPHLLSDDLIPERYRDQSIEELRQQFASARKHLRYAAMLHLLTTTEALLRLGFEDLSRRKTKPAIFRRFRQIERDRREKIRLEEDILDTWIEVYPETARSIREFKRVLPLRDWLAHGRYWNPKIGRAVYEPPDVFDVASEMLDTMRDA
jgi:hypothetical protein